MKGSGFFYLTRQGLSNLRRNKLMSFASIGVLTACLVITGIAALLSINVNNFVDYLGAQNKVIVYLQLDADQQTLDETARVIRSVDNILDYTYVSKEEALEETKSWIAEYDDGAYANALDGYEGENNPLYASYRVTIDDLTKIDQTVAELEQMPGVDFVDSPGELAGGAGLPQAGGQYRRLGPRGGARHRLAGGHLEHHPADRLCPSQGDQHHEVCRGDQQFYPAAFSG